MKTNRAGIELIKEFEGLRLTAYKCPAGVWTIGYGHTTSAGPPAVKSGMKITGEQASEILVADLVTYEAAVMKALTKSPTENQFSAMVSLCYNIGAGAFTSSTVVKKFNAGDAEGAAAAFRMWKKGGGKVLPGLVRRREAEIALFNAAVTVEITPAPAVKDSPAPAPAPAPVPAPGTETAAPVAPSKALAGGLIAALAALIAALAAWIMKGGQP
jgi:lysozyme